MEQRLFENIIIARKSNAIFRMMMMGRIREAAWGGKIVIEPNRTSAFGMTTKMVQKHTADFEIDGKRLRGVRKDEGICE